MQCDSCGIGGLHDSWERDFDWFVEIDLPDGADIPAHLPPLAPPIGCTKCFGLEPSTAWAASQEERLSSPVQESHFGVHLSRCECGQRFATVFTERIDWAHGEDDQTWLVVYVSAGEQVKIEAEPASVAEIARDRRFLVRAFPSGGELFVRWRDSGFAIGPHD